MMFLRLLLHQVHGIITSTTIMSIMCIIIMSTMYQSQFQDQPKLWQTPNPFQCHTRLKHLFHTQSKFQFKFFHQLQFQPRHHTPQWWELLPMPTKHLLQPRLKSKEMSLTKWKELNSKLRLTNQLMIASKEKNKPSLKLLTKEWLKFMPRKLRKQTKHHKLLKKLRPQARKLLKMQKQLKLNPLLMQLRNILTQLLPNDQNFAFD